MNDLVTRPALLPRRTFRYNWCIGLALLIVVVAGIRYFHGTAHLRDALDWVAQSGPLGMICYVGLYLVACVFMIPGSVLTVAAGTAFGLAKGVMVSSLGATLGATAAFLVSRYLARGWVLRRLEARPRFKAIDQAVAREGWKIVGLTRLSLVFPFVVLNYAYGVTGVSLRDYFIATWLGMLPATFLYVYFGVVLRDAVGAHSTSVGTRTPFEWIVYGLGLLATVAVTVYVTRLARRALGQTAKAGETDNESRNG